MDSLMPKLYRAFDAAIRSCVRDEVADRAMVQVGRILFEPDVLPDQVHSPVRAGASKEDRVPVHHAQEHEMEIKKTKKDKKTEDNIKRKRVPYHLYIKRFTLLGGIGTIRTEADDSDRSKVWSAVAQSWKDLGPSGKALFTEVYKPLLDKWNESMMEGGGTALGKESIQQFEATLDDDVLQKFGFLKVPLGDKDTAENGAGLSGKSSGQVHLLTAGENKSDVRPGNGRDIQSGEPTLDMLGNQHMGSGGDEGSPEKGKKKKKKKKHKRKDREHHEGEKIEDKFERKKKSQTLQEYEDANEMETK